MVSALRIWNSRPSSAARCASQRPRDAVSTGANDGVAIAVTSGTRQETDPRFSNHQRMLPDAVVVERVGNDEQAILLDRVRTKGDVTRGCRRFDADPCLDRSRLSSSTAMSAIGVPQICDASAVRSSNTWSGSVSWTGCCRRTASGAVSRQPMGRPT